MILRAVQLTNLFHAATSRFDIENKFLGQVGYVPAAYLEIVGDAPPVDVYDADYDAPPADEPPSEPLPEPPMTEAPPVLSTFKPQPPIAQVVRS